MRYGRNALLNRSTLMLRAPTANSNTVRASLAIEVLRVGVGIVWLMNFVFIVAPANNYFGNFAAVVLSLGPTSIGGSGLEQFVAANAAIFAWLVAIVTGYLAFAFILGLTTRWACIIGGIFSAVIIGAQLGSMFAFPGGTDVGEHPLYLVIYVALVLGGAGAAYSLDHRIAEAVARRRAYRAALNEPAPRGVWAAGSTSRFFLTYFIAGILISFGMGMGLMVAIPATPTPPPAPIHYSYANLTISINATTGWPQYTPANFTVSNGEVIFTITDLDSPMNWSPCPCVVTGTNAGVEIINGTPVHVIPSTNVAHSFSIPNLGLSVYLPGLSVIRFTVDLINPGSFGWFCVVPCGAGANPYSSPPMGVPGYMTGTMTIT